MDVKHRDKRMEGDDELWMHAWLDQDGGFWPVPIPMRVDWAPSPAEFAQGMFVWCGRILTAMMVCWCAAMGTAAVHDTCRAPPGTTWRQRADAAIALANAFLVSTPVL